MLTRDEVNEVFRVALQRFTSCELGRRDNVRRLVYNYYEYEEPKGMRKEQVEERELREIARILINRAICITDRSPSEYRSEDADALYRIMRTALDEYRSIKPH